MDFAKVEKRVRTTGGGSTGTVRCVLYVAVVASLDSICYNSLALICVCISF